MAIFLINRLPSFHCHSKAPWETLFGKSPNFSLFKSFDCACFPLLRPYTKHKFSLHSKECIFLGYASNSKGYLCLDPTTSRIYVSHHVTFNKSQFPFFNSSSSSHQHSNSSSTSNNWLSTLLDFHPCQTPLKLGPTLVSPNPLSTADQLPLILGPILLISNSNYLEPTPKPRVGLENYEA